MNDLNLVKLNTLCTRITDGAHYSPEGTDEGYPMLSVKDMRDNSFDYSDCKFISEDDYLALVKGDCKPLTNDVVIAKDGSYLKHVFVIKKEIDQAILSSIGILRPNLEKIEPKYLKYYLQTKSVKETVAKKYVSGSALPRIILKNFGEIEVIYRSLEEQKQIAKVLSDLDAKIEVNNKINQELEALAQTIYDYWFVQFDFPDQNGKPYKSSGGKMVYNEELKRKIPEGWEVKRLNFLLDYNSGHSFSSKSYSDSGKWKIITIKSVQENGFDTSKCDRIKELPKNLDSECNLEIGDLLMSLTGNTGRLCFVTESNCLLNQRVAKIWSSKLSNYFIYLYFKRPEKQKLIEQLSSGSSQANLSPLQLFKSEDIIPENPILNLFEGKIEPIFKKIIANEKENQELAALRDWLLPMLMNGQVTVGEAKEQLGMVAEDSDKYN